VWGGGGGGGLHIHFLKKKGRGGGGKRPRPKRLEGGWKTGGGEKGACFAISILLEKEREKISKKGIDPRQTTSASPTDEGGRGAGPQNSIVKSSARKKRNSRKRRIPILFRIFCSRR